MYPNEIKELLVKIIFGIFALSLLFITKIRAEEINPPATSPDTHQELTIVR